MAGYLFHVFFYIVLSSHVWEVFLLFVLQISVSCFSVDQVFLDSYMYVWYCADPFSFELLRIFFYPIVSLLTDCIYISVCKI